MRPIRHNESEVWVEVSLSLLAGMLSLLSLTLSSRHSARSFIEPDMSPDAGQHATDRDSNDLHR